MQAVEVEVLKIAKLLALAVLVVAVTERKIIHLLLDNLALLELPTLAVAVEAEVFMMAMVAMVVLES
jgi:hypothetical protein